MLSVVCTVFLQESKLEKRKCYQENHKENTFIVFFFFNLCIRGPTQLKPVLFKGQLDFITDVIGTSAY